MRVKFLISIISMVMSLNPLMNLDTYSYITDKMMSVVNKLETTVNPNTHSESSQDIKLLLTEYKRKRGDLLC